MVLRPDDRQPSIFTLRQLQGKFIEQHEASVHIFIDFAKAFDTF